MPINDLFGFASLGYVVILVCKYLENFMKTTKICKTKSNKATFLVPWVPLQRRENFIFILISTTIKKTDYTNTKDIYFEIYDTQQVDRN